MNLYRISSYVPEETFLLGKDARFCSAAFEDAFVVDGKDDNRIISAKRNQEMVGKSLASAYSLSIVDTASLINLFDGSNEPLMLPCQNGTLMIYPAWQKLEFSLVFLLKENIQEVEKAYKNAQRHAFSMTFDTDEERKLNRQLNLETKLCVLNFYMSHLFGDKRETNVTAHILMLANLLGCRLHEMSVSCVKVALNERELETFGAYLACAFMTMRRYNGDVSTSPENGEDPTNLTHVPQEYGILIQQSVRQTRTKPTAFDLPAKADFASFATHPAFKNYKIEETDKTFCLHFSLHQKAYLSSLSSHSAQNEIVVTLFLL